MHNLLQKIMMQLKLLLPLEQLLISLDKFKPKSLLSLKIPLLTNNSQLKMQPVSLRQ